MAFGHGLHTHSKPKGDCAWAAESDDPQVLKQRAHALEKQLKAAAAVDLKEHEEHEKWRLTHAMMYWTHSNPVPSEPALAALAKQCSLTITPP